MVWIWAASGSALRRQMTIKSAPQARPDAGIFDKNDEGNSRNHDGLGHTPGKVLSREQDKAIQPQHFFFSVLSPLASSPHKRPLQA